MLLRRLYALVFIHHDTRFVRHRFRVDIHQVVRTRVGVPADHLLIEMWRPGRGLVRIDRR